MTTDETNSVRLLSDAASAFGVARDPDGATRVAVIGHLLHSNRTAFKQLVVDQLERGGTRFVLDLLRCGYIDSAGLGVIVSLSRKIRAVGGTLTLEGLNPDLVTLLNLTRLDHLFTFTPAPPPNAPPTIPTSGGLA